MSSSGAHDPRKADRNFGLPAGRDGQDEEHGFEVVDLQTVEVRSPSPGTGDYEDKLPGSDSCLSICPSSELADYVHLDLSSEKHTLNGTTYAPLAMQLIRAPRSRAYYRGQCLRAMRDEALRDSPASPNPPKPPRELFLPGGIVYVDGEWKVLSNGILTSIPKQKKKKKSSKSQHERTYPKSDFEISIGWNADKRVKKPKIKKSHNPYSVPTKPQEGLTTYGRLLEMEGLEQVKEEFRNIETLIDETSKRKGRLRRQDLNLVLLGNPGTGKRTIAALYRDFLVESGVWGDAKVPFEQVTGYGLAEIDAVLNKLSNNPNGVVLLIDAVEYAKKKARAQLLDCIEDYAENAVVVLTGADDGVTRFLGSRPHGRWQFRRRLRLPDYDDAQLHTILDKLVSQHSLEVEGVEKDAYLRIIAKRVGRNRNSPGFGNVHDLLSTFEKMMQRRSLRIQPATDTTLPQREPEPPIVTHNCFCDGPLCEDRRDVYITGIRFKCTVCDDIDFCAKCDAYVGNKHNRRHPLIQFKTPVREMNFSQYGDHAHEYYSRDDSGGNSDNIDDHEKSNAKNHKVEPNTADGGVDEMINSKTNALTLEDIVGEEPADIRKTSEAWKELEKMVGLQDVKKAIGELLLRAKTNWHRELRGQEPLVASLNRVFLGPPGTGKTTVAKLYGQILADMGVLSTNEVVYKTPVDFISQYIGGSESKTMEILNATVGKVLIIDDAHMLYSGSKTKGTSYSLDKFRVGIIDTLVSQLHNRPGEDRCVILIGYPDMMEEMYQNVNAGFRRRFPLEEAFRFENYGDNDLLNILKLKMANEDIKAEPVAMDVAAEVMCRARDRPNFGNGGDVENLLGQAKTRFRERIAREKARETNMISILEGNEANQGPAISQADSDSLDYNGQSEVILKREDFDPEWDRGASASAKCEALFEGLIGFEGIIGKLQGYQKTAANLRLNGKDPRESIPFTFVFKGPPGTGKTHTARIIGQIFYDMGFLSTNEVIECSASQLVGQFMGQTGPTVVNLFERALGKVLFIDEAYRLSRGGTRGRLAGSYQDEAIGEIVDCITKKQFHKKLIIILAGYTKDMDELMSVNAGLRSRFATEIAFPAMNPIRSREHLFNLLKKKDIEVRDNVRVSTETKEKVLRLLDKLGMTAGWAGARDVGTLAAVITEKVYRTSDELSEEDASEKARSRSSVGAVSANGSGTGVSDSMERAKFRISTRDLIEFLKDMLRERIRSGRVG